MIEFLEKIVDLYKKNELQLQPVKVSKDYFKKDALGKVDVNLEGCECYRCECRECDCHDCY